jgi:hypothetical protein
MTTGTFWNNEATPESPIKRSSHPSLAYDEKNLSTNRKNTMRIASAPTDAVTPIMVPLLSRIGMPHSAYVSTVALRDATTVQFAALHVATAVWNAASVQRQLMSLSEQGLEDRVASKH